MSRTLLQRVSAPKVLGSVGVLAIASVIYSQFNIYGGLGRDSAIYLYGGQRVTHGIPPYASIMDPKGPIPSILCGFGVAVARIFGHSDLLVVRAEYCALSILGVLGIYLLVLELFHSIVAAVVASAVFASFKVFAWDALHGPDGHTPGIVFLTFALWLTVRRNWYWAGLAASLAFFSWQPLAVYPLVIVVCAVVWSRERRMRAVGWNLAGVATPFVALFAYFAAEGYPGKFFEGTFIFPLIGIYRPYVSFTDRVSWIFGNIPSSLGASAVLLWMGLGLLLVMAAWEVTSTRTQWRAAAQSPIVLLIVLSGVIQVGYMLYDYIGWTHALPLFPYAAVGFGAATARLMEHVSVTAQARSFATVVLGTAVTVLTVACVIAYHERSDGTRLAGERAASCALQRSVVPGTRLWVIDDPEPLVLLHRANPDNYPYVGGGLAAWRSAHTPGGFGGWMAQVRATASVVVVDGWREPAHRQQVVDWLRSHGYHDGYVGPFVAFVNAAADARMAAQSILLAPKRHAFPLTSAGRPIRNTGCTSVVAG